MTQEAESERELVISRSIAAPPDLVWRAFTDPAQIAQWWGPHGFTTTITSMDLKPGVIGSM